MKVLLTGVTGFVGHALVAPLKERGHSIRGFARDATRVGADVDEVVEGDAITGRGFDAALDGIDTAYYLIHSMEGGGKLNGAFVDNERRSAEFFAVAAAKAGVKRVVYLGGPMPADKPPSPHLSSRVAVEEILLEAAPNSIAMRASMVIGARSRSFRFLVRLIERLPLLAIPAWHKNLNQPIDGRDMQAFLIAAADAPAELAGSWDTAGPEVLSYGAMMERIADCMLVRRPVLGLGFSLTPLASVVAAEVAGEDVGLIRPLMESLESTLLPRPDCPNAAEAFGIRLHSFDAAVERALRDLEALEPVRAR